MEKLFEKFYGILGTSNGVTFGPRVRVNLVVVATRERLITEEVDSLIFSSRDALLSFHVSQTVGLVPAGREYIKGNLTTDRVAIRGTYALVLIHKSSHLKQRQGEKPIYLR